jgi:prepilin-type N-terminal cleavage/methylation domain-containing protein
MNKKIMKQEGFTLIELLVVIAIIGLLSTLSIVALNSARVKARDATRVASVKQWQTALELYYSDQGGYPAAASSSVAKGVLQDHGVIYLGKVTAAPTPWTGGSCAAGSHEYVYAAQDAAGAAAAADNGVTYQITYCLEGGAGGVGAGVKTATPAGMQ